MPALLIILILIVLSIYFGVVYLKKTGKEVNLKKRNSNIIIFVLSLVTFVISLRLFWNLGIYSDKYGSAPSLVSGGFFWLIMNWMRLGILFVLCLISGLRLLKDQNKSFYKDEKKGKKFP